MYSKIRSLFRLKGDGRTVEGVVRSSRLVHPLTEASYIELQLKGEQAYFRLPPSDPRVITARIGDRVAFKLGGRGELVTFANFSLSA